MTDIKVVKELENITTISQACNTYNLSRFRVKYDRNKIDDDRIFKIIILNNVNQPYRSYKLVTEKSHFDAGYSWPKVFYSLSQFIEYLIDNAYEVYIVED